MGRLENRTAIVTGGAAGIGHHYAEALAREGATVAIVDLAPSDEAVIGINAALGRRACFGISANVSDEIAVEGAISTVLEKTGRIDILVNNAAMYSTLAPVGFADIEVVQWDKVMAVNLRGPFLMAKHAVPAMITRKYGKIINISSGTAYKGMPLMLHYVTSKGGILAFTRALSREVGAHNICVNTLAPGLIRTEGHSCQLGSHCGDTRPRYSEPCIAARRLSCRSVGGIGFLVVGRQRLHYRPDDCCRWRLGQHLS